MGKQRGRLDPGEVKRALAAAAHHDDTAPAEPFNSPFAAVRAQLEKLVPAPPPPGSKPTVAERLRKRAAQRPSEPSELARVRAERRAERTALAEAVKPLHRKGARHVKPDGDP